MESDEKIKIECHLGVNTGLSTVAECIAASSGRQKHMFVVNPVWVLQKRVSEEEGMKLVMEKLCESFADMGAEAIGTKSDNHVGYVHVVSPYTVDIKVWNAMYREHCLNDMEVFHFYTSSQSCVRWFMSATRKGMFSEQQAFIYIRAINALDFYSLLKMNNVTTDIVYHSNDVLDESCETYGDMSLCRNCRDVTNNVDNLLDIRFYSETHFMRYGHISHSRPCSRLVRMNDGKMKLIVSKDCPYYAEHCMASFNWDEE